MYISKSAINIRKSAINASTNSAAWVLVSDVVVVEIEVEVVEVEVVEVEVVVAFA